MSGALELTFFVHIGSIAQAGVDHWCVEHVALAVWQNHSLREESNGGLAGNTPRLIHFCDSSFDPGAGWNHGLATQNDSFCDSAGEGISALAGKCGKRFFQFHFEYGACGQRGVGLCHHDGRSQQHTKQCNKSLHLAS